MRATLNFEPWEQASATKVESDEPKPHESWRRWEIDLLVAAYLDMLQQEMAGGQPVKAEVNRRLQQLLPARTRGSIEYKLQNVSAVLDEEHLPFIDGYKPLRNYQADLKVAVNELLGRDRLVAEQLVTYGDEMPPVAWQAKRLRDVLVETPSSTKRAAVGGMSITRGWFGALRDAQNRRLGQAGEQWVVDVERAELHAVGRDDLAHRVEWTARDRGDGFGYDVASFLADGRDVHIEVKTTNLGPRSPFYISRHELATSEALVDSYRLYRVFDFVREPRVFMLRGAVEHQLALDPLIYQARVT
jgi:hypothetical protein